MLTRYCFAMVVCLVSVFSAQVFAQQPSQLFKEGFELLQGGRPADAAGKFEQGLRQAPDDPMANLLLGDAYLAQQKNDRARAQYEKVLSLAPSGDAATRARQKLLLTPGYVFKDCDVCPEMVVVPPGSFVMGSPNDETGRESDEGPVRPVTIGYTMAIGKFEITFEQWDACRVGGGCKAGDAKRFTNDRHPANAISWDSAIQYIDWLIEKTGKKYRLLTEAEWEYAARAGTETARYWGESPNRACEFANVANPSTAKESWWKAEWPAPHACEDGYTATTSPPGSFKPNAFGLYDMMGNVAEWVQDCYVDSYAGAPSDGSSVQRSNCENRVIRGGAYNGSGPRGVRSALRVGIAPSSRYNVVGFRVARTLR